VLLRIEKANIDMFSSHNDENLYLSGVWAYI